MEIFLEGCELATKLGERQQITTGPWAVVACGVGRPEGSPRSVVRFAVADGNQRFELDVLVPEQGGLDVRAAAAELERAIPSPRRHGQRTTIEAPREAVH